MLSMTCFSAIKCAVEVCLHPQLKNDLLFVNPLEFDAGIATERYRKEKWTEMVKKSAAEIVEKATFGNGDLRERVQEDILDFVIPVARKMLTWSEYHHRRWNIPRALLSRNLRSDVFTDCGIIDNEKAAEGLLDDRLTLLQRYGVVCSYCLKERILPVHRVVIKEIPPIHWNHMAFMYYHIHGQMHDVIYGKQVSKDILEQAVNDGNKAVVNVILQECIEKDALVHAAVRAIELCGLNDRHDWIPFSPFFVLLPRRRQERGDQWVPSYYYLVILSFLFSKMNLDQRKESLSQHIKGYRYQNMVYDDPGRLTILDCLLKYPYQFHFMDTVKLMWEFLPENNYAVLLLKICDRVESTDEQHIEYGEDKSFDYLGILRELWNESPENFRKYVLSNQKVTYADERAYVVKAGEGLLVKLLALENFRTAVKNIIKLILTEATAIEKENIISDEVINICCELSKKKRWEELKWFLQNCFSTDEERNSFTKKVIYTKSGQRVFIDFLKSSNWDAVREFTKWGRLNEDEVNKFKEDVIRSVAGEETLMELFLDDNTKVADEILNRCLPSENTIEEYKGELALSDTGVRGCNFFLVNENTELAENWFSWCRLSQEKIQKLKNISLRRVTSFVIDILKSGNSDLKNAKFEGGKWERTEKFLAWCLPKSDIKYYKKISLLSGPGERLLYDFINSYRYEEAEELLKWLNLSDDEIRRYRLETANIFVEEWIARAFVWIETVGDDDYEIEGFDTLLDWCLRSEDQVRSFRDGLRSRNTLRMSCGQRRVKERFLSKAEEILEELIAKRIKT